MKPLFDRNFPKTCDAEMQIVFRCLHEDPGSGWNALNALSGPDQQMGIQQ
jgi:hypothetical protein